MSDTEKMSTQLLFNNQKLKDKLALVKLPTTFRNTCVCMCFPSSSKFKLLTIYRSSSGILVVKYNVDASNVRLKFTILTANTFSLLPSAIITTFKNFA